jgi:carbon monoxide dehydrogenase subunit G
LYNERRDRSINSKQGHPPDSRGRNPRSDVATILRTFTVDADVPTVWAVYRDIGALHTRLVPGFVTNTVLEEGARMVTFANGMTVRERIVSVDDDRRRLVWSATGGRTTHHNASVQVFDEGDGRCRVEWITDLLPDDMASAIEGMMDQAVGIMQRTLARRAG